jgi:hypothetical protein
MRTTIEMAREVDPVTKLLLDKKLPQGMDHDVFMWFLERFEALVRADEREIDAKVCESLPMQQEIDVRDECAAAIRNRGNP